MSIIKKGILATTLAASALAATASPTMARDYYRHHDNGAGLAVGIGIIGLAVGAVIASNHNDRYRDGRYYDRRYEASDGRYYRDDRYYDRARAYDRSRYDDRGRDWQRRSGDYDSRYYDRRGY